jgi:hypothetical protein
MSDPFESSKFSIAWAKDHIAELQREIDAFLGGDDACTFITEPNINGTYQVLKVKFRKPMPRSLRGHAGDAAINLRNALGQAICSVFALADIPKNNTYFPIARDLTELESTLTKGWCKGLPQGISDIVRRSKPYKGGNNLLWALNKLSGINKHSILRPVMLSNDLIEVSGFAVGIWLYSPPRWKSDKEELVVARIPAGRDFDINYQAAFFIAFNEIEFLDGEEVTAVLNKFVDVVEGIVMAIEADAPRIGLL